MKSLEQQMQAVNQAIARQMKQASYRAVVSVALLIANKSIPLAPVDTGHLRNSSVVLASRGGTAFYTQKRHKVIRKWDKTAEETNLTGLQAFTTESNSPQAVVSFIASYAVHVHEGDPSKNWNDGGPKFLERGINASEPLIPAVVKAALASPKSKLGGPHSLEGTTTIALDAGTGEDK